VTPLDPSAGGELERAFLADAPQRLDRLADGLERLVEGTGGPDTVRFEAHSLRGAAGVVDRDDLVSLSASIEELLLHDRPDVAELAAAARLVRAARQRLRPAGAHELRDQEDSRRAVDPKARRVLYVEDNPTSMRLIELLLRDTGVQFVGAATAAEGLAAARASAPDLILLDLQLPDGNGESLLRSLRAETSLRAVPIVMVSADAARDTVRRLLEAGADDYLTKPVDVHRAADLIERLLQRRER
jgi:CheY-like chemotaxis protein/HPt (histidine-containing phosphotransfer) domain-containing protein